MCWSHMSALFAKAGYIWEKKYKENIEMMFCSKFNREVHDQHVQIYFLYKFVIAYNRSLIGFTGYW